MNRYLQIVFLSVFVVTPSFLVASSNHYLAFAQIPGVIDTPPSSPGLNGNDTTATTSIGSNLTDKQLQDLNLYKLALLDILYNATQGVDRVAFMTHQQVELKNIILAACIGQENKNYALVSTAIEKQNSSFVVPENLGAVTPACIVLNSFEQQKDLATPLEKMTIPRLLYNDVFGNSTLTKTTTSMTTPGMNSPITTNNIPKPTTNTTGNMMSDDILNTCTPYNAHTRTPYVVPDFPGGGALTCGQALGTLKHLCDQTRNSITSPQVCSDQRYQNWLVNDYPNYPLDEWFGSNVP